METLRAEQNRIALSVADRVAVLSRGQLGFVGPCDSLSDSIMTEAYLGTENHSST